MRGTIDLRSDTVTLPTKEMIEEVEKAVLGDSLRNEDPTVRELEEKAADIFGKEEGLLLVSGTMANQAGLYAHSQRGSSVLCSAKSHIGRKEAVSTALISGCAVTFPDRDTGVLDPDEVEVCLSHRNGGSGKRITLVAVENTLNEPGGKVYPLSSIKELYGVCRRYGIPLHIDGSRVFHAMVEENTQGKELGDCCDTLSFCLSKGLGAPLGALLVGSSGMIRKARECRNLVGGGMRQAGLFAACGLFALEHGVNRLMDDHNNARIFSKILKEKGKIEILNDPVETNMVLFSLDSWEKGKECVETLEKMGILIDTRRIPLMRVVTHLNHSRDEIVYAAHKIVELFHTTDQD